MSTRKYPEDFINKIICGDCLEVMKEMPDKCVDLIVTDPPYPKEFSHVWKRLAVGGSHVLKNGGFLITLFGHYQLPLVMESFKETGLDFFWMFIVPNHQQPIMHGFKSKCSFKPGLIFRKGNGLPNRIFIDNFALRTSTSSWKQAKAYHHWGQAESIFYEPIDAFSIEQDVILDPFCGGASIPRMVKDMYRNFIGLEINPGYCKIAEERLAQGVL